MSNTERLAALLFHLARDEMPFGNLIEHVRKVEKLEPDQRINYLDEAAPMGELCRDLAKRLVP